MRDRTLQLVSPNQNESPQTIVYTPKLKYRNSFHNDNDVLFLSKHKHSPPTRAEIEHRKQKKNMSFKLTKSPSLLYIWQHGMHKENFQFGPKNSKKVIEWMQRTYPAYEKKAAAKSFFFRALKRHNQRLAEGLIND